MTGSIVTFDDAIPFMPIEKIVASIEPQQDLHGYESPWAAGAGKNLINQDGTDTNNGYVHKAYINTSGTVSQAEGNWDVMEYVSVEPNTTYTISGVTASGSSGWVEYTANKETVSVAIANNIPLTFTTGASTRYVRFNRKYDTDTNVQLEKGSTATTYAPYSNICPISGWTGLSGERNGKNLLPNKKVIKGSTREILVGQDTVNDYPIHLVAGVTYAISDSVGSGSRGMYYQKLGDATEYTIGASGSTFTPTQDMDVRIWIYIGSGETIDDVNWFQLEVGSSATAYEPYITPRTITCTWQTEAGTVYGGNVDVVSGVLTADMSIVDMGTLGWVKAGAFRGFVATTNLPEGWPVVLSTDAIDAISDCYKTVKYNDISSHTVASMSARSPGTTDNKGLAIKDPSLDSYYDNFDATAFASAVSGRHVVFKSTVPQTYQLTPQQVQTLVGQNNVWVDTGDVTVTYQSTSGSTPVRTSLKSPLKSYSYNALKLFGNTFIEHGKG